MRNLYDVDIRVGLRKELIQSFPIGILEELRVHNGNAIADLVGLHSTDLHCFEIKGDFDKLTRAREQAVYFDLAFPRSTLVTTSKFIDRAAGYVPKHWGLMLAMPDADSVAFREVRKAQLNPYFNAQVALLTLWKSEMLTLVDFEISNKKYLNRKLLSSEISNRKASGEVLGKICELLQSRLEGNLSF